MDLCLKIGERTGRSSTNPAVRSFILQKAAPPAEKHMSMRTPTGSRERWGHAWWITDEDRLHFERWLFRSRHLKDVFSEHAVSDGQSSPFKPNWALVADLQRAAQDQEKMVALLAEFDQWPGDRMDSSLGRLIERASAIQLTFVVEAGAFIKERSSGPLGLG